MPAPIRDRALAAGLAAALLIATPPLAAAQIAAYPTKPIRLIVASGAGGGLDFGAHLASKREQWAKVARQANIRGD